MTREQSCPPGVLSIVATFALVVASGGVAHACPVCFGASDSPMAQGMNAGVLLLVGVTAAVLAAIAAAGWRMAGRAREHAPREQPAVAEGGR